MSKWSLKESADEAVESGRFFSVIAFIDEENRIQFRCFTESFPYADMGKVVTELRRFANDQIKEASSKASPDEKVDPKSS
jgi:hypothetical protein